tara:strand:+ start:856 stop:1227 length:372 start_codon:yes stop_codon:yes gene_type:complete
MKICFDIDGVICKTYKSNYAQSKPIKSNIKKINQFYENGHKIIIFTARYMGRSKDDEKVAFKKGYNITSKQLKKWGVKFHVLKMGKPSFDLIIDDKAIFFKKNWSNLIDNEIKKFNFKTKIPQ